ncbi:MAG: hypothetical protein HOO94_09270 [Novosphingobium sp.]|nr:hypothetical protein [Novosphingobium sp.]
MAVVGLIGALVGGLIQAAAARGFEARRFERESKWDLYSKYFLTLGELSFSDPKSERHHNALSLMAQLRGRIGVVGSAEVIEAVGNVFRFPNLHSDAAQEAMANALAAMRSDVGSRRERVSKEALMQLMFGSREVLT